MTKMFPAYDDLDIEKRMANYKEYDKPDIDVSMSAHGILTTSPEYTAENFKRIYIEDTTYKMTRKEFVRVLSLYRDSGMCDDVTLAIINKLIGDRKLFKKIVFCTDGSYRNNRFYLQYNNNTGKYTSFVLLRNNKDKSGLFGYGSDGSLDVASAIEYINWVFNHYDTLFIQTPTMPGINRRFNDLTRAVIRDVRFDPYQYRTDRFHFV